MSFNGGPGSASVWMHIAYTGPKVLKIDDEGYPVQPYGIKDNPNSILDVADIVYINPVNTAEDFTDSWTNKHYESFYNFITDFYKKWQNLKTSFETGKEDYIKLFGEGVYKQSLNEQFKTFSKSTSTTSIFLSHSHLDKAKIEQAKLFFENLGIRIYVDWADQTMPEKTNGITAQRIKNQIISLNDKFILLATNNAVTSKWCNWEVGIADPFKLSSKKMALLPLADNSGNWNGNEYLQIYPSLKIDKDKKELFVEFNGNIGRKYSG